VRKSLEIPYFTDERDITSLPVFPLDRLQDQEGTKQRMIERGTRVLEFQDHHYMRYLSRAPEYGTGSGGSLHNLGSVWDKQVCGEAAIPARNDDRLLTHTPHRAI